MYTNTNALYMRLYACARVHRHGRPTINRVCRDIPASGTRGTPGVGTPAEHGLECAILRGIDIAAPVALFESMYIYTHIHTLTRTNEAV